MIRGDARRFRSGWLNKDDKNTWVDWHKTTGGADVVVSDSIWGNLPSAKDRKGLIDSITRSAKPSGSILVMVYWDHSKVAARHSKTDVWITENGVSHKKKRGGHLVFREESDIETVYEVTAWPEDKMLKELQEAGWTMKTDNVWSVEDLLKEDPIGAFLSLMVLERK